ncbi:YgcG family protein [Azonexus sp.]|uniref:TPM domain-containing protein n=1 Tax=Azonexus sp. TaxID=1872668 RepID=UPI0035B4F9CF
MRLLLFLFCLIALPAWAVSYTPQSVPNPRLVNGSHVADPDQIIGAETLVRIDARLRQLEQRSGVQVAVVALDSIGDVEVFSFAQQLFESWGIGHAGRDDGLLVLLVRDQRAIRLHTGYGLEGALPDVVCKRIQREFMVPAFQRGDFGGGLLAGIVKVDRILADPAQVQALPALPVSAEATPWEVFRVAASALGGVALVLVFGFKSANGYFSGDAAAPENPPITPGWSRRAWLGGFAFGPAAIIVACNLLPLTSPLLVCGAALYGYFALLAAFQAWRQQVALRQLAARGEYFAAGELVAREQAFWGWMAVLFPLPFLFHYLFQRQRRMHYRNHPRACPKCQAPMRKLDEAAEDEFLSRARQMEETLQSADHDVWLCTACGATATWAYPGTESKYTKCPSCKCLAYTLESDTVLEKASYESQGRGETIHVCKFCGKRKTTSYRIPKLVRESAAGAGGSLGSSSSSGGSSWGGGSSGGGGAGSNW